MFVVFGNEDMAVEQPYTSILITGAGGYVGRQLVAALARDPGSVRTIVATDVRVPDAAVCEPGVTYVEADVRAADFIQLFRAHATDLVVHLAAVVTPGADADRQREYDIDVRGTARVLEACTTAGVRKIIYTSSGAAYGYHADNPPWLDEEHPLRGNPEFAYADHKRQVEELLARWRVEHPELLQLIFRPGVILGARANNQITRLFERRYVLGLAGAESPFVIVWDQDVVGAILRGIRAGTGIYNLAGDGTLSLREMAAIMNKPYVPLPVGLVTAALWLLARLRLTQYGPEQVNFLRYRPVLSNRRLKGEFGYQPQRSTRETFRYFLENHGAATA
jgi:UDP-glucose 4-epimerase